MLWMLQIVHTDLEINLIIAFGIGRLLCIQNVFFTRRRVAQRMSEICDYIHLHIIGDDIFNCCIVISSQLLFLYRKAIRTFLYIVFFLFMK